MLSRPPPRAGPDRIPPAMAICPWPTPSARAPMRENFRASASRRVPGDSRRAAGVICREIGQHCQPTRGAPIPARSPARSAASVKSR